MAGNATRIGLVAGALAVLIGTVAADPAGPGSAPVSAGETIMPPPAMFRGTAANVTEHLGGKLPLDLDKARKAVKKVANTLDMSVERAAYGMFTIVNNNMVNGIRRV